MKRNIRKPDQTMKRRYSTHYNETSIQCFNDHIMVVANNILINPYEIEEWALVFKEMCALYKQLLIQKT